jgi:DNA repair photolyase
MRPVTNPPNPFVSEVRELLGAPPPVNPDIFEETAKTILSHNESPDLPFRWSLNPYRGCFHACAYCYARPSHEYWGFGAGTDFESKLNTDPYQPLEAEYKLTRACLKTCANFRNPVGIISKAALLTRDMDIFQELHQVAWIRVFLSIPFASDEIARKVEPQAPSISKRFATIETLAKAGIPTAVSIAPVIPGLSEHDIPIILSRARDAGAQDATFILLRLNDNVEKVFVERMGHHFPDRIQKIMARLKEVRQGQTGERIFFKRHQGQGRTWEVIEQLFEQSYKKLGFPTVPEAPIPATFTQPGPGQLSLF